MSSKQKAMTAFLARVVLKWIKPILTKNGNYGDERNLVIVWNICRWQKQPDTANALAAQERKYELASNRPNRKGKPPLPLQNHVPQLRQTASETRPGGSECRCRLRARGWRGCPPENGAPKSATGQTGQAD